MTALAPTPSATEDFALMEQVLVDGDLTPLTPKQRATYYMRVCQSLGLNPLTKPFEYLVLGTGRQAKLVLYPTRTATDQLAALAGISFPEYRDEMRETVYVYHVRGVDRDGRTLWRTGAVPIVKENGTWTGGEGNRKFSPDGTFSPLSPTDLANAMMKAETKAYRRCTLALAGLGWLDESELETVKDARRIQVNHATGEIIDAPVTDPQVEENRARFARLNALAKERGVPAPALSKSMSASQVSDALTAWEDAITQTA